MVYMFVTYSGSADTRFDRDHWLNAHLPLVRACWEPHGLEGTDGFFPAGGDSGLIAICACAFRDEDAARAALASPETQRIMADVKNVTDVTPKLSLAKPL